MHAGLQSAVDRNVVEMPKLTRRLLLDRRQISEQVDARRTADRGRSQYRRAQTPSSFEAALMDINVKKIYQFHQC